MGGVAWGRQQDFTPEYGRRRRFVTGGHRENWQPIYVDRKCPQDYVDICPRQEKRNVHLLFFDTFRHMSAKNDEKCRETRVNMSLLYRKIATPWHTVFDIYVNIYVVIYVGQCPGHMSSYVDRRGPRKLFFHPH